jgi:hypothetical protein
VLDLHLCAELNDVGVDVHVYLGEAGALQAIRQFVRDQRDAGVVDVQVAEFRAVFAVDAGERAAGLQDARDLREQLIRCSGVGTWCSMVNDSAALKRPSEGQRRRVGFDDFDVRAGPRRALPPDRDRSRQP